MFVVSPTAILYDTAGKPIAVSPNVAIPAGTSTILVAGTDGSVARVLSVDATGRLNVAANLNSGTNYVGRTRQTDGTLDLSLLNVAPPTDTGQVAVPVRIISSLAGGGGTGTVVANQGTAAALAGRWPVQVTDGTNTLPTGDAAARSIFTQISDGTTGPVAVKAASTPATVTDRSLVVQISPNQEPIPTTIVPTNAIAANAQGKTGSLAANTFTAIRQTTYTEQTTNAQRSFASSSASDSAAGVGARQIRIEYLDQNGNGPSLTQPFYTETITLNGTTPVNTVATNICFVEHIEVITVGSNGTNVGTITMFSATGGGGVAVGSIGVGNIVTGQGDNEVLWAHHYVPNLYVCEVYTITGGCYAGGAGGGVAIQFLRGKVPTSATSAEQLVGDIVNVGQGNALVRPFGSPLVFAGPYRLVLYGTALSNNTSMFASFDFSDRPA